MECDECEKTHVRTCEYCTDKNYDLNKKNTMDEFADYLLLFYFIFNFRPFSNRVYPSHYFVICLELTTQVTNKDNQVTCIIHYNEKYI